MAFALLTCARQFLREELGQDLIEYTLLLAFVVLMSAAIFFDVNGSAKVIWKEADDRLARAKAVL